MEELTFNGIPLEFREFPKIPRLIRACRVTEKIDGTNAAIYIGDGERVRAASRTRFVTVEEDNYGFAAWVEKNKEALVAELGLGVHRGEWWGLGINRGYHAKAKNFSLFEPRRREDVPLAVCRAVPVLYEGLFDTGAISAAMLELLEHGSYAQPGYMKPEGVVVQHLPSRHYYKITFGADGK